MPRPSTTRTPRPVETVPPVPGRTGPATTPTRPGATSARARSRRPRRSSARRARCACSAPPLLQRPVRHRGDAAGPHGPRRRAGPRPRAWNGAGGGWYAVQRRRRPPAVPRLRAGQHGLAPPHLGGRRHLDRHHGSGAATAILGAAVQPPRAHRPGRRRCARSRAASRTSTAPSSRSARSAPSCRSTSTSSRRTTCARTSTPHLRWSEVDRAASTRCWDRPTASASSAGGATTDPTEVLVEDPRRPTTRAGRLDAAGPRPVPAATASLTLGAGDHITARGDARAVVRAAAALPRRPRSPASARRSSRSGSSPPLGRGRARAPSPTSRPRPGGELAALLIVSEIRAIRADDLWLSPAQGRETVALHFTWKREPEAVLAMVPARRGTPSRPFAARPHWGKVLRPPRARPTTRGSPTSARWPTGWTRPAPSATRWSTGCSAPARHPPARGLGTAGP